MRRMTGGALAMIAMLGAAVPAEAGDRRPKRAHHHDRSEQKRERADKVDAGDVVVGALVVGGLLALLGKKKAKPHVADDAAEAIPAAAASIAPLSDAEATDACGAAAESAGSRLARIAQVTRITTVDPAGEGWFVKGMVKLRDDYRDAGGHARGFRCAIGAVGVPSVHFDGDALALASSAPAVTAP